MVGTFTKIKNLALTWRLPSVVMCIVITVLLRIIPPKVNPSCRVVNLWDSMIDHPHVQNETFPASMLIPIVILPVFLVYLPVVYLFSSTTRPAHREFLTWALTQWVSWCLSDTIVDVFKVYAGRFRPDFIDRLRHEGLVVGDNPPLWVNNTVIDLCQEKYIKNPMLREGRLSFPSGHSAMSFGSMVPLVFFLCSKLRPFYYHSLPRLMVCLLPLSLSFVVAISRTLDYWHNFDDIVTGSMLGAVGAVIAVFMNFDYVGAHGTFVPKKPVLSCCDGNNESDPYAAAESGSTVSGNGVNRKMEPMCHDQVGFLQASNSSLSGSPNATEGVYNEQYVSAFTRNSSYPGFLVAACVGGGGN